MKNLFKKMAALFCRTWLWTLLSVLFLALCIWFVGPLLAVADHKFWESPTSRLLSVSLLFLLWGLSMVFVSWRSAAGRKKLEADTAGQEHLRQQALIEKEHKELSGRFRDALRVIKLSSLYGGQGERLPWYLLIGPAGSGKTSLLDFSGLEFPLNKTGRKLTRDTRGTASSDWYFADQAVIIDTPGRYLEQATPQVDASAWLTLLGLLRNRRRTCPVNGVLVTLPVDILLENDEVRLEMVAEAVRNRLDELYRKLHVDVPVYLVLTKADSLQGFDEFFDQLSREEGEQVLGATFGKDQRGSDSDVLKHEFEELLRRLGSQVIMRIHQEHDLQRRGRMLGFPDQFGLIGHRLCMFAEMAFAGSRYQRATQLRGFYLTCAPHLLASVQEASAEEGNSAPGNNKVLPGMHTGRARFIRYLLSRVIFPEAALAMMDKGERWRVDWARRGLYCAALMILALFGALWANGFATNHDRLESIRHLAQQWTQQRSALNTQADALAILKPLNLSHAAAQVFPAPEEVSLHEHSGLYQGEASNRVLMDAYQAELQNLLLPRVARTLEAQIQASMQDREQLLESLRAYLMLYLPQRRDQALLRDRMAADWALRYAGQAQEQNELNGHLERLLRESFVYPVNDALVAQARQALRSESLATIVYRVLREQARNLGDYRLAQHIGTQASLLVGTQYPIPGFYTRRGYQQFFVTQGVGAINDILRDNWVLGDGTGLNGMELRSLMVELEQLYFRDYANHWSEAVGQVSLQPFDGPMQGATQVSGLISANSPLLQLLTQVRDNTQFAAAAETVVEAPAVAPKGVLNAVASAAVEPAAALLPVLPDTAKKSLQRRFEPLHRLLDEHNGPAADLLMVIQALNEVQLQLASLARSGQPELLAFEMARTRMSGQRDALSNLRNASTQLPQPVGGWFNGLAESTWSFVLGEAYRYINQRYRNELYSFYEQSLDKRYPFHAHSGSDVAINDFREFFKAQGLAERFFDSYMKPFVSGDPGHYRLRTIDGSGLPASRAYLDQMASVQTIRKSFFAENPDEPLVQFKLEPYTLDPAVSRAEFRLGNQMMEYRHGPIVPVSFKWPTDADDGRASLVLERMTERPIGIEKSTGPWSFFRLLDLMQVEYLKGRDVLVLKADVGGLRANYLLLGQRSANPFDVSVLRRFRMPAQL
ncbi:type VI secretion system membrane subunit TssM [Pseudomonas sp. KFB-139]|uniref:Type VI secretion system membrane subunit TssM n=1 Tax=Pseudomonas serbiensis TaxID=3064350 RepID=A0ABT9CT39_9PSED|nr:type VI secretion system membrane subunit TssM [Pseudomonas sp. KFB-138]MDO7927005.1 type VI secretion system membrane subunit TssM [Pseudomonas sp. KFB-138]